jgi:hypothetical protein
VSGSESEFLFRFGFQQKDTAPCRSGSASVVDPKTFFSDSDPQKIFSDSDTDSDTDSADIYFRTNHSFNGLRTFSEYNTMKKNFVTVKICASFHLTLVFVMLYY